MVSFARPLDLTPRTIPFDVVKDLFGQDACEIRPTAQPFPMSEAEFRELMSPEWIVTHTKGVGGPQPAEPERMLQGAQQRLDTVQAWLSEKRSRSWRARMAALDKAFAALLTVDKGTVAARVWRCRIALPVKVHI